MNVLFFLNGKDYNRPDNSAHLEIQKKFIEKLESALAPILLQLNSEVGSFRINYDDEGNLLGMTYSGFSLDSNAKMNILFNETEFR